MNYQDKATNFHNVRHRQLASRAAAVERSKKLAPSTEGLNFFTADRDTATIIPQYMDGQLLAHLKPHPRNWESSAEGVWQISRRPPSAIPQN